MPKLKKLKLLTQAEQPIPSTVNLFNKLQRLDELTIEIASYIHNWRTLVAFFQVNKALYQVLLVPNFTSTMDKIVWSPSFNARWPGFIAEHPASLTAGLKVLFIQNHQAYKQGMANNNYLNPSDPILTSDREYAFLKVKEPLSVSLFSLEVDYSFHKLSVFLRADRDIVLAALKSISSKEFLCEKVICGILKSASLALRGDEEIALEALQRAPTAFPEISNELKRSREFLLKVIKLNSDFLKHVSEDVKSDPIFIAEVETLKSERLAERQVESSQLGNSYGSGRQSSSFFFSASASASSTAEIRGPFLSLP